MKKVDLKKLAAEASAMERGEITPGRVWRLTKRADGTYERVQEDPEAYRQARAVDVQEEALALKVRRKLGISQNEFAALFGISAGTLRGWEQKRRRPAGAAALLLRVAERHPDLVRAVAAAAETAG